MNALDYIDNAVTHMLDGNSAAELENDRGDDAFHDDAIAELVDKLWTESRIFESADLFFDDPLSRLDFNKFRAALVQNDDLLLGRIVREAVAQCAQEIAGSDAYSVELENIRFEIDRRWRDGCQS